MEKKEEITLKGKLIKCLTNPLSEYRCYLFSPADNTNMMAIPESARVYSNKHTRNIWDCRIVGSNIEAVTYNKITLHGVWKESSGYGMRFSVNWYEQDVPTKDVTEMYHYIQERLRMPPHWSRKFVEWFGDRSIQKIEKTNNYSLHEKRLQHQLQSLFIMEII